MFGCVSCYFATYFLWRPAQGRLLISEAIRHDSTRPTLLQALYFFSHLALTSPQDLASSPDEIGLFPTMIGNATLAGPSSDESSTDTTRTSNDSAAHSEYMPDVVNGTQIGFGATGQVILLKDSNIAVKHCDTHNNPRGRQMMMNELNIYKKLAPFKLECMPHYVGERNLFGQHFLAMEYIQGAHCDWEGNQELTGKVESALAELRQHDLVHLDLKPENVLLTIDGQIKIIDYGLATLQE